MARYKSNGLSPALPKRTLEYLERGAPEGTRNAELFDAACQARDAGRPLAEFEERLLARAVTDGLPENEARQTIHSAFSKAPRDAIGGGEHPPQTGPAPDQLPSPQENGFAQLLEVCFRPDEFVAIAPGVEEDGEVVPRRGVTLTPCEWQERITKKGGIDRCFSSKHGLFVRINPMCKHGASNEDVVSFRHALVEFDRDEKGRTIPKEEQFRLITESGLPVSALIDSGNKSLHAWIRVEAANEKEYRKRVDTIWNHFAGKNLDTQNRNPSRLSRCPDGRRTVNGELCRQSLLATQLGAESWEAWENDHLQAEPPPFIDLRPFIENGCKPESPTVGDVGLEACLFYAGRINEVHGEPGTGKSNVAIAASIEVMKSGGTVLYIDPEDTPAGFTRRSLQFGVDPEDLMRRCHYLHNPTPEDILSAQRWAASARPTLVVLDGLAESMAAEGLVEDKAGDVLSFFRERLRPFAETAGSAVLVSDHVAKSSEDRGRWARGSGAKLGRYDGVSYNISLIESYSPGHAGAVKLTIAKDRNGGVGRVGEAVAEVHFEPGGGGITLVSFRKPEPGATFRPTAIMTRIVTHLERQGEAGKRELRTLGKSQAVDLAISILEEENRIVCAKQGRKHVYSLKSTCTYRLRKKSA